MINIKNTDVFSRLIQPIISMHGSNPYSRICSEIPDLEWLKIGIMRSLSEDKSGRGFIQNLFYRTQQLIGVGLFFEALKSKRRLSYLKHSLKSLAQSMLSTKHCPDPFSICKELDSYHIFGGDGHYHSSATHDEIIDGKKRATQHFYTNNMRTRAMTHMTLAEIGDVRKREHDTRALERQTIHSLRQGAVKGEKVLYVWDRACLKFSQWEVWKRNGIYFLSRSKKDLKFTVLNELEYEKEDTVNNGVISDQMVLTKNGEKVRRVLYYCPFKKKTYSYLTNLSKKIRPGVIAFLYKTRWDIEKVFDDFKNKMYEKKSWASHSDAKTSQANFLCIAYNLLLLLEDKLKDEDVENVKDKNRKLDRMNNFIVNFEIPESAVSSLYRMPQRITQRPFSLFRWIRSFLTMDAPWGYTIQLLQISYCKLT